MKLLQTAVITIMIAFGLWFLLNRYRPASEHETSQEAAPVSEIEINALPGSAASSMPPANSSNQQNAPPPKTQAADSSIAAPPLKPLTEQEVIERQKSIRSTLSALYTAQVAYFAEYNRYSSDLGHIGFLPPDGTIKARFGFLESYTPNGGLNSNEDPARSSSDAFISLKDDDGESIYSYDEYSRHASLAKYERYCENRCSVTADQFELISAVNLDGDETLDVWIIDSRKNLRHVVDDTKE